jgi:putative ABC transport system permease protein
VGDDGQGASILTTRATAEVLDVLGIKLLAGRTLPEVKSPEDTTIQVVINKSTADYLQLSPEEAIGKQIMIFNSRPSEVVGVTEDFHFTSVHQKIGPYCFNNNTDNRYIYLLVKIESQNITATIEKLESSFKKLIPAAFEYTFLDSQMAKLYDNEQRLSDVIFAAASIAIFIACLGLYALAAYTAEQRVKEIGIRKVLGASVNGLVVLLSKDFMKLIGIALLIGLPIGYYVMNQWLQEFAYKTTLDLIVFVLTGIVTTVIAWLTVSFESIRTAFNNPVNSLRNE